ncbi:OmpA family protein [Actinoallomurus liliacearum]
MRRGSLVMGAALVPALLVLPGAASAGDVPDANLQEAVRTIDVADGVRDIDLGNAVIPLEEDKTVGDEVTVSIAADVLFDFGKATLTDVARRRIAEIAERIHGPARVAGFTDAVGSPAANLTLSRQRAEAVKAELARQAHVTITATGYGEARPVAPNRTPDGKDDPVGRAKNRRVEISYQK